MKQQHLVARQLVFDPVDGIACSASRDPLERECAASFASGEMTGKTVQNSDFPRTRRRAIRPVAGFQRGLQAHRGDIYSCFHADTGAWSPGSRKSWKPIVVSYAVVHHAARASTLI